MQCLGPAPYRSQVYDIYNPYFSKFISIVFCQPKIMTCCVVHHHHLARLEHRSTTSSSCASLYSFGLSPTLLSECVWFSMNGDACHTIIVISAQVANLLKTNSRHVRMVATLDNRRIEIVDQIAPAAACWPMDGFYSQ